MSTKNDPNIIDVKEEDFSETKNNAKSKTSADTNADTSNDTNTDAKIDTKASAKESNTKKVIDINPIQQENDTDTEKSVDVSLNTPASIGYSIIIIVFGFMLGWSFLAPLDSASLASGVVTVESYRKTIQHLEGGIVETLNAKDGQSVKKGDTLLVLDKTQLKAQLEINEAQYVSLLSLSARLQAERHGDETITFDEYLLQRQDNPDVAEVMSIQTQIFNARSTARHGEVAVLRQRIEQLHEQINGLTELQKSQQKQIKLYKEEISEFKDLLKDGFADKTRMRDMQRRVAELEGEVARNSSSITGAKIKIGESELQILQIEKQFQLDVTEKSSEVNTKLSDISERIIAIQDKIDRTVITAPVSGMVIGMTIHTIGGVVAPGSPILEIVPQDEQLIIEAQVSPTDIDKMHTGLIAEVRFSSFKSATTPVIEGEVFSVSPDRLVDKNTGMPYYLSRIRITPEGYKNLGDLVLLPGMPADVLIKIGERTVFEYLVDPISNAFARSFIED